jgi:hypothetical protein
MMKKERKKAQFFLLCSLLILTSCGELFDYDTGDPSAALTMELGRHSVDIMVGDRYDIPTVFTPDSLSNKIVYWYSADTGIAAFDNNTLVGVAVGTTMVKAISVSEQIEDSCEVNVIPRWELHTGGYPYDMVIYADVKVHGEQPSDDMLIGAVCDGELRGIGVKQNSNGISYMLIRVWSPFEYGDIIRIGCYRRGRAVIEYFPDEFTFDGEAHGTLSNLYPLVIK